MNIKFDELNEVSKDRLCEISEALSKFNIVVFNEDGNCRSTLEILEDIAIVCESLTL